MKSYPLVLSEHETLAAVCAGQSIARYGDGELKLCLGHSLKCQRWHPKLANRLRSILQRTGETCLVGIPNIHEVLRAGTERKKAFWSGFLEQRFTDLLVSRPYVSAFISRPDSAPWIDTPAYWSMLESLWLGQDITLVRGSVKSFTVNDLLSAGTITEIVCRKQDAFQDYDDLLDRIGTPKRAILCCGPTATVLAVDLALRGVHAIDLGHAGMFVRKHRAGLPMWLSKEENQWQG